jgi:hypothetical protein
MVVAMLTAARRSSKPVRLLPCTSRTLASCDGVALPVSRAANGFDAIFAEPRAKAQTPKRPRLLTAEERRQRNTLRKQRWRQDQQKRQQARDAA